jgi:hypothetical protein
LGSDYRTARGSQRLFQLCMLMKAPLLSPSFRWNGSATHNDSTAFRERQRERMRKAQQQPTNVATFKERKHGTTA